MYFVNIARNSSSEATAMAGRRCLSTALISLSASLLLAVHAGAVQAALFSVNAVDDTNDGACNSSHCSLREAVAAANAAAGADEVRFAITGTGPHQIDLLTALPMITQPLTINGYSQANAVANTRTAEQGDFNAVIQIIIRNGANVSLGFDVATAPFVVRGVSLGGFNTAGLFLRQGVAPDPIANAHIIEGNLFGLRPDGMTPILPMMGTAIDNARPIRIGGALPAQRNVVAGFSQFGIRSQSRYVIIEGNLIGMDAAGVSNLVIGAGATGLQLTAAFAADTPVARIGGAGAGQRNRLMGRGANAMSIVCGPSLACYDGMTIQGNTFNLDLAGNALPGSTGALFLSSQAVRIDFGGTAPGAGNLVGAASLFGVVVQPFSNFASALQVAVQGNRFVGISVPNTFLPIRLATSGGLDTVPLANDPNDADSGVNHLQNKPVVSAVFWDDSSTTVQYSIDSATVHSDYPISVELHQVMGNSGEFSGRFHIDSYGAADAQQTRTVVVPHGVSGLLPMRVIATSAAGGTSEVSGVFGIEIFADGFEL